MKYCKIIIEALQLKHMNANFVIKTLPFIYYVWLHVNKPDNF